MAQPSVSSDDIGDDEVIEYVRQTNPEIYERLMSLSPEEQQRALMMMRQGSSSAPTSENTQEVGDL